MNSNLNRALSAALVAFGGVAPALAQYDYPGFCIDPTNTNPYSADFNGYYLQTPLFGASIGVAGTVAYGSQCDSGSAPVRGRIGFTMGPNGSIQDDLLGLADRDNFLRLTEGIGVGQMGPVITNSYAGPYIAPTTGGLSYARVYARDAAGAITNYLYGSAAINLGFVGRSGRYMYTESTVNSNNIGVRCVIDVLGDASRVSWRLTNNTANPLGLGLWFGQSVVLVDENGFARGVPYVAPAGEFDIPFITIPGRKPLTVDERFPGDVETTVPSYVNFSINQKAGYGLQVINNASALSANDPNSAVDQTPVDEFVIGDTRGFLIDGTYSATDPTFGDFIFNAPGNGNADAAPLGNGRVPGSPPPQPSANVDISSVAYIQKWQPNTIVATGGTRDIVTYYRPIGFDSSYSPSFTGYTAVVDTPKSVSTNPSDPNNFDQQTYTIRVNVDNTGGFSITDTSVRMQSVQVVLNLPAGMHAPNSTSRTITKTVTNVYSSVTGATSPSSSIDPGQMGYVDFQFAVDPTTFGNLPYTVTITPQPGFATKTVTGTINVATTPRLLIRPGANLVSPPWQFADNSWDAILGLDLNTDFQSFTWDSELQQYIPQTTAERGRASWILSKNDLGFRALGGSPQQPNDEFPDPTNFDVGGLSTPVRLHRGWNLVGNPYNYAFPLGQLVGIPVGQNNIAYSYADLIRFGYTDGSFATYDADLRGYTAPIQGVDSKLQPNHGYWVYANADFDLQFPPLYELFLRSAGTSSTTFHQRFDNWKLQLSAATANANDTQTYVGIARTSATAKQYTTRKAPMAPTSDAIRSYVSNGTAEMGQLLRNVRGTQTFTYNVATRSAGPVTISWPNLREIPSNLAVTVKDLAAKKSINARSKAGYTFNAGASSVRSFEVTIKPQGTVAQRIGSVSATTVKMGSVKNMKISFFTSARGSATLQVFQGRVPVGTIAEDIDITAGNNVVTWPMTNGESQPLPNGTYTLLVSATSDGGKTATRQFNLNVRR
jgi:hypothetical protein